MTDDPYVYPGTTILRDKLDIRDAASLNTFERTMVAESAAEGIPTGDFDLAHLQAIHHHFLRNGLLGGRHLCCLQNESEGLGAPMKIFDNPLPIAGLVI